MNDTELLNYQKVKVVSLLVPFCIGELYEILESNQIF